MNCLRTVAVLLLLALWLPASSHAMLEHAGLIHQQDGEKANHDHDAADGLCVNATGQQVPQPSLAVSFAALTAFVFWLSGFGVVDGSLFEASGLAPPGVAPPELTKTWHFSFRTSLSARAPSLTS